MTGPDRRCPAMYSAVDRPAMQAARQKGR